MNFLKLISTSAAVAMSLSIATAEVIELDTEVRSYTITSHSLKIAQTDMVSNPDGSVTVLHPQFVMKNRHISLGAWSFSKDSQRGFCSIMEKELVSSQLDNPMHKDAGKFRIAQLHANGSMEMSFGHKFSSITCK